MYNTVEHHIFMLQASDRAPLYYTCNLKGQTLVGHYQLPKGWWGK